VSRRAEPWPAATAATAPVDRGPGATGLIKRAGHARASARAGGDGSKRAHYATTRGNRFSGGSRGVCRDREARTHNAAFGSGAGWQSGDVTSGCRPRRPLGATPAGARVSPRPGGRVRIGAERMAANVRRQPVRRYFVAMRGGGPGVGAKRSLRAGGPAGGGPRGRGPGQGAGWAAPSASLQSAFVKNAIH
jgi:hypothetical protein